MAAFPLFKTSFRFMAMFVAASLPAAAFAQLSLTVSAQDMAAHNMVYAMAAVPAASTRGESLPDTPQPQVHASTAAPFDKTAPSTKTPAPKYAKTIAPNELAYQPITAHDKIIIGARDLYSVENFAAIITSAGYEQVVNGEPNYGNNSTAFGKRVGAAAIRETAQGVFTDTIFHPIFRTDPRYFVEGNQYNFFHRTAYAASRVFITRTDSGKSTLNAALLLGYAGASGLNNAYYPQINRNFKDNATGYGGSLGGAMVGFFVSEFSSDLLHIVHKGSSK